MGKRVRCVRDDPSELSFVASRWNQSGIHLREGEGWNCGRTW